MAFRIHESVVRGEIDNRVKGIVRGKVWVEGRAEPIVLELQGNAWPDLAGCVLRFMNPLKPVRDASLDSLNSSQRGSIGDLTASRKVRVFDVPLAEAWEMFDRKEKPPEHLANCLYLEWYSEANGRVVIESADYEVTISPPEWRLTPEEDMERAKQAADGMTDFMKKAVEALDQAKGGQKDQEAEWNEHDYEKFLRECDARTDKYMELMDKFGNSADAEGKIAKEMGWDDPEEQDGEERMSVEEMNAISEAAENEPLPEPDPHREGIDWIRTAHGDLRHPLQHRCFESAIKFHKLAEQSGLEELGDKDLEQFVFEFQTTSVKLAGALNPLVRGGSGRDPALTVAYLKRALGHLHACQAGLEGVRPKRILPELMVAEAREELFEICEDILKLMDEFRGRGEGFEHS